MYCSGTAYCRQVGNGFCQGTLPPCASKSNELAATDSQQLKQAIALVRQFARSIPASEGYCRFQEYLNHVEQRACV